MSGLRALLAASALLFAVAPAAPAAAETATAERAYELVSPGEDPNGQKVDVLPVARPSVSGDAVAFQMFGTVDGGPSEVRNTYLAKREPEGWTSQLLTPPAAPYTPREYRISPNQFFQFNEDDSKVLVSSRNENPLVPGEPTGVTNLYLRDNDTGTYQLITTAQPHQPPNERELRPIASPRVAWASKDLQHVLFDSYNGMSAQYFPDWPYDAAGTWSPATGLQLASIQPDGQKVSADAGAGALQLAGKPGTEYFSDWYGANEHAISEDGSRIFFTNPPWGLPNTKRPVGNLYERRDNGTPFATTVQVDAPGPGAPPQKERESASRFITATADGHRALFLSCAKLTADSTAVGAGLYSTCQGQGDSNELYIYDEATGLTDISTGDPAGGSVLGVAGASEDLNRVYFVAKGALTGAAVAGRPNLYLWDSATGLTFLAELTATTIPNRDLPDASIWEKPVGLNDARVSADGSTIAFSSGAPIDPTYPNIESETGYQIKQIYVYRIGEAKPRCVTCIGPAAGASTLLSQRLDEAEARLPVLRDWGKRNLLPDGSALFFESSQPLLPADHNLTTDVYEYTFATNSLGLISSGRGASPSNFVGASADGRDVFFRTSQSLVPSDINGAADIYDARRGGGDLPGKTPPAVPCGEHCPITPASTGSPGPGNAPAAKPLTLAPITPKQIAEFARTGRLTIVVGTPGPGLVVVRGIARPPLGAFRRVATAKVGAPGEGPQRLTLRLKKGPRRLLAKKGHLQVRLQVRFGELRTGAQFALKTKTAPTKAKPKSKGKGPSKSKAGNGNA